MRRLLLLSIAAGLAAATAAVASRLEVGRERPYDVDFVPRSSTLRWLSVGHPSLAAHLQWLRLVQYVGDSRGDQRGWDKLYPLADVITDLDPRHGLAYQLAGNVLAGAGRISEANRILEKGVRNVHDRYILAFHRAVNAMMYEGDYALAARWFERAAATPGAPEHLSEYVLSNYVKANQADGAIGFLEHLIASTREADSLKALRKQLELARMERAALEIDTAVERYRQQYVLMPFTLEQLVAAGLLPAIPPDPLGGTWLLDEEGRAHSSVDPHRLQRPLTPAERAQVIGHLRGQLQNLPPQ